MDDLETLAGRMVALLLEEAAFLEEAAARLKRERKALVSGDGSALRKALEGWQELAEVRGERDKRRAVLLDRISSLTGLRHGEINVSTLRPLLSREAGERLAAAGARVKKAAREAGVEAAVGKELLEEAARFHQGLLLSIGKAFQERGIAPAGSGHGSGPGISLLDTRG